MKKKLLASALLLLCLCAASACAETPAPVVIPLKDIWAWQMPGTSDVRELEPDRYGDEIKSLSEEKQNDLQRLSLVEQIRKALAPDQSPKTDTLPEPDRAFVVPGKGRSALEGAYSILVDKKVPVTSLSAGDVTVVFFSYQTGIYVHLNKVELRNNEIDVVYQFDPHATRDLSEHFALIPLGRLAPGKYKVNIIEAPIDQKFLEWGYKSTNPQLAKKYVCKSFTFSIDN